ncbi:hypothetical protein [Halococcus sediminicola]
MIESISRRWEATIYSYETDEELVRRGVRNSSPLSAGNLQDTRPVSRTPTPTSRQPVI